MTLEEILVARPSPGQPRAVRLPAVRADGPALGPAGPGRGRARPAARLGEPDRPARRGRRAGRGRRGHCPGRAGDDGRHGAVSGRGADRGRRAARRHAPRRGQLGRLRRLGVDVVGEPPGRGPGAAGRAGRSGRRSRIRTSRGCATSGSTTCCRPRPTRAAAWSRPSPRRSTRADSPYARPAGGDEETVPRLDAGRAAARSTRSLLRPRQRGRWSWAATWPGCDVPALAEAAARRLRRAPAAPRPAGCRAGASRRIGRGSSDRPLLPPAGLGPDGAADRPRRPAPPQPRTSTPCRSWPRSWAACSTRACR